MKKTNKKQQSGRSMIEMVGVLAVMGLITAGAFVLISSASSTSKRNRTIDDIMEIAAGVRSVYADHDELPDINSEKILAAIHRSPKTQYTKVEYQVAKASATTFTVTLDGIPEKDCSALAIKEWKSATDRACKDTKVLVVTFEK